MNIRFKVFYTTKEEQNKPMSWRSPTEYKNIRASNEEKAKEVFKTKYPDLIPVFASKW